MKNLCIRTAVIVILAVAMWYQTRIPEVKDHPANEVVFGEIEGYESEELAVSEAETTVLPEDTRFFKRAYRDQSGRYYTASAVASGRSRASIHRPELCMPSQGFLMIKPRYVTVGGKPWRFITLERGGMKGLLAYTMFNSEGARTASHVRRIFTDIWDRSINGSNNSWTMLSVHLPYSTDDEAKKFLVKLEGAMTK